MISDWFLELARCPVSHSRLRLAEADLVRRINEAVDLGRITNRIQQQVSEPLDEALVNEDQSLLFPVRDDIPTLIADEAIPLEQLSDPEA
jgi:uncharacterized protein YbaR (Trm112 family)